MNFRELSLEIQERLKTEDPSFLEKELFRIYKEGYKKGSRLTHGMYRGQMAIYAEIEARLAGVR